MRRILSGLAVSWAITGVGAQANDSVIPASHPGQATVAPLYGGSGGCCPPIAPITPYTPGMPVAPGSTIPYMPGTPGTPSTPETPGTPGTEPGTPNPLDAAINSPFAQAAEAGGLASTSFNESFDGDFSSIFYARKVLTGYREESTTINNFSTITTPAATVANGFGNSPTPPAPTAAQRAAGFTQATAVPTTVGPPGFDYFLTRPASSTTVNNPTTVTNRVPQYTIVRAPLGSRYNGVQVVDNDQPRPVDRAYFLYNFYSNVGGSLNPGIGGVDMQRQIMGFEKTFLSGDASFGMRLPFIQQTGPLGLGSREVGDLSLLFKYAFVNNLETGNVVSAGFVLTTPTGADGGDIILTDGLAAPHSYLFQPWTGFVYIRDRAYFQGISNLIVPSDSRDPTIWGNSLGLGYWLYQNPSDRMVQGVIPHLEVHVRTPLNARDPNGPIYLMDQVNITTGVHLRAARATLTGAVCVPVVGPIPWNIEAMGYVNWRF